MANKRSFFRHLNNERGSMLIAAVGITVVVALTAVTIASQNVTSAELSLLPRIRSNMAQVELQVRHFVLSPASYTGCDSTIGPSSCSLVMGPILALEKNGIFFDPDPNYDPATRRFTVTIRSNHEKIKINPRSIDIEVPTELLQSPSFQCPDARPFFIGFTAAGVADCREVSDRTCGVGEYVGRINRLRVEPECVDFGRTISCSTAEKVGSFEWVGGATVNVSCVSRPAPVINPSVTITGGPTTPPPPPPPVALCGPANGVSVSTPPTTNLCSDGSTPSVATGATDYTWTCGANPCSAPILSGPSPPGACTLSQNSCSGPAVNRVQVGSVTNNSGVLTEPSASELRACTDQGGTCLQAEVVLDRFGGYTGIYKLFCHTGSASSPYVMVNGS